MDDLYWFALQVRPRFERLVSAAVTARGYEAFLPLYVSRRRWSDRIKELQLPLFDGYVFCRLNPNRRLPILVIPGVIRLVGIGAIPVPVADKEIDFLRTVTRSGILAQPWPYLNIGQRVRIEGGPLRNLEGILIQVRGVDRLVVSVSLLQRSIAVEISREWAFPVAPPQPRSERPGQSLTRVRSI